MSLTFKKTTTAGTLATQGLTDLVGNTAPAVVSGGFNSVSVACAVTTSVFTGIGAALASCTLYRYIANVGSWVAIGAAPTATNLAGSGSVYVPANTPLLIDGNQLPGGKLATIADSAAGIANLAVVTA